MYNDSALRPYVALPDFLFLDRDNLQYLDVLVYTALRWFNRIESDECFPKHETIGIKAGVSKNTVIASVKRLEEAGLISVKRSNKIRESNYYYFTAPRWNNRLEKIPKDFFETTKDLSSHERAMLLCIRQFFNNVKYECHEPKPIKFFAKYLGLTENQVRKQFSGLISKDYIKERYTISKFSDNLRRYYKLTDKIDWSFDQYQSYNLQTLNTANITLKVA